MSSLERGFENFEYEYRVKRAQQLMHQAKLDCLLLTTEPEIRYFTGFLTRFWESPTRPWFLIVPLNDRPIAIIPSIGVELMAQSWIQDIRSWSSPNLEDDGISLLADTLRENLKSSARIGMPMGHETHIRMPMDDFNKLTKAIAPLQICGDEKIMRDLRMIKSEAEINKIRNACTIAGRAFDRVGEFAQMGGRLDDIFRKFQIACLEEGADWVPYLSGAAGCDGYRDVISPATSQNLINGDILMLDTGLVYDGYFCDFDRNFAVGKPSQNARNSHACLMDAVAAGLETAKPGATGSNVFQAMNKIVAKQNTEMNDAARLGHGLGMQLTEWPSIISGDNTVLQENMVLTLEPYIQIKGDKIMVHEENIVIRSHGAELLSPIADRELVIL